MTRRNILLGALATVATLALPVFAAPLSGLKVGESVTPFHPKHLAGPLAGTSKCFPCTFQDLPQAQVWVNGDDKANVVALAKTLATEMKEHEKQKFKALVVVLSDPAKMSAAETMVKEAAKLPETKGVAMAVLAKNDEAVTNYGINTAADVKNTVFVYKNWKVADKFVNLKAADSSKLVAAIDSVAK
jgi:hypothetical protein